MNLLLSMIITMIFSVMVCLKNTLNYDNNKIHFVIYIYICQLSLFFIIVPDVFHVFHCFFVWFIIVSLCVFNVLRCFFVVFFNIVPSGFNVSIVFF